MSQKYPKTKKCPTCDKDVTVLMRGGPKGHPFDFVCVECHKKELQRWNRLIIQGEIPDQYRLCSWCGGFGAHKKEEQVPCGGCGGKGFSQNAAGLALFCFECMGCGQVKKTSCVKCDGTGWLPHPTEDGLSYRCDCKSD